ncbi:hypothetical protein AN214_03237 [Pseudoalteromonas sp. P1-9]|uniref:hypothetical protein n=1 Tax=Pseudoalteromonas sp. P1-9 TaxID=1710354 RepID=UPI0006D60075|nr:hypothetical protein [Pseudoalteromonas sp. P1-9]KPV94729.1 hypothetical protein AN214_03237 [Pseudoalteromonas sp. P1-9]
MYFKKLSHDEAVYRVTGIAKLLLKLLSLLLLLVGILSVLGSDSTRSLPIWVSGFFCWLGWIGVFGGYVCRINLSSQTIQLKASNLYTVFNRVYHLTEIKGFRAMTAQAATQRYRVYMVLNDGTYVAVANPKERGLAVNVCKNMAEFTGKPYENNLPEL